MRDERKTKKRHSTRVTADRSGKIMPQISRDERGFNNKTYKKDFASKKKKNEAVVTRTLRVTRDDCWTSRDPNRLAEPLTTVPKDNRTSASDDNKNYHFVST